MKEKFYITNISCSSCASKIENNLKKLECVKYINISTNNNILEIDTNNMELVKETIKSIEPKVKITKNNKEEEEFNVKKELILLIGLIAAFFIAVILIHLNINDIIKNTSIVALVIIYLIAGKDIYTSALKNFTKFNFFDENSLMFIASLAAFGIGAYEEAVAVILFFRTGEFLQDLAVSKSKRSIKSLLQVAPNIAHLVQNSDIIDISPQELKINDIVLVKPGEKIPIDGIVRKGESSIDTKTLTGESIPKKAKENSKVFGGSLNLNGMLEIKVSKLYQDTSISKIIDLVQNASISKAKTESFITKFARIYTPIIFFLALAIAILPPLFGIGDFQTWIYRALVVLMVSCPCALVISVPLAYFGGIGSASKNSILIKGANFLESLGNITNIAFDKTGTLTKGTFKIVEIVAKNGFNKEDVLQHAYCAENFSNHPIALAIKEEYKNMLGNNHKCKNTKFEQIDGLGIKSTCNYGEILAGNDKMLHKFNIKHDTCNIEGTVAHISVNGKYAGYILIADELKESTKEAIKQLRELGVEKIAMLTGDNKFASKKIADELKIDYVKSDLLPEEKAEFFGEFTKNANGKSAFVGDGINDAPSIAMSDVGISMGKLGSDVSKESADILIINDNILSVAKAIKIAKKTKTIIWQNITFAIGVKALFIILGLLGIATIWEAVFGDVGVALLALANSMRILKT